MNFVSVTALIRVPTSILNAGSDGRPKQMPWGEHDSDYRQYVSAQCQKYWLRKSPAFMALGTALGMAHRRHGGTSLWTRLPLAMEQSHEPGSTHN